MARRHISDEEILAQIPNARLRASQARAEGLRATSARYDANSGRVVVETTTGHLFGFPAARVPALRNASPEELEQVELSPSGSGLHWEGLDVDLDVPALIVSVLGRKDTIRELARTAGSVTSERKAAAARVNGARGGRPSIRRLEQTPVKPSIKVCKERSSEFRVAASKNNRVTGEKQRTAASADKTAPLSGKAGKRVDSGVHARKK